MRGDVCVCVSQCLPLCVCVSICVLVCVRVDVCVCLMCVFASVCELVCVRVFVVCGLDRVCFTWKMPLQRNYAEK